MTTYNALSDADQAIAREIAAVLDMPLPVVANVIVIIGQSDRPRGTMPEMYQQVYDLYREMKEDDESAKL